MFSGRIDMLCASDEMDRKRRLLDYLKVTKPAKRVNI